MTNLSVEQALLRANGHLRKGEHESARALYVAVLAAFPGNLRAKQGLARLNITNLEASSNRAPPNEQINTLIETYNQGRLQELVAQAKTLVAEYPSSSLVWNILAVGQKKLGQLADAEKGFLKAVELNPTFVDAYYNLGLVLQEQGKLDEAIAAYQRALEIEPAYAEAHYNMGNALTEQGKLDEAIVAYRRTLKTKPAHAEASNNMGNALKEQGKPDEAMAAYRNALKIKPAYADAYFNMGVTLQSRGKLNDAIAAYQCALEINPTYAEAYYNMGNVQEAQEKLDEAILFYQRTLEIKPTHADAYYNIGNLLQKEGKLNDAITAYQRALEIEPAYVEAHNNMGNALKEQGKLGEAIAAYQRAIAIKPAYAEAFSNMGNALKEQCKLDEAIAAYQHALEIKPAHAETFNNLGIAFKEQGKIDEAISSYQSALKYKPNYAEAYNNLGVTLMDQRKLIDAPAAYQRALKINPHYAKAHFNIGITLQEQGKHDEAIEAYQCALNLKPDYAEALFTMGNALQQQGNLDEAIAAFQRALKINPAYAEAYNNMGNALQEQGKLDEAITAYRRTLEIRPQYAEAYNNLGVSLVEKGKLDEAIAAFRRALEIQPSYSTAEAQLFHQRRHICDFTIGEKIYEVSSRLGVETGSIPPFAALPWEDNPSRHLLRALRWSEERYKQSTLPIHSRPKTRPQRIKIGYFSADFHDHATMYLMAGLLRQHNKSNFEIFAYSYGSVKSGTWRKGAEHEVDHFFDVTGQSDLEIVDMARSHAIDIAIDLKGYTSNTRSHLFQYRLAPIQINYLGYPGTMGAKFIDYIIADPVVIPVEQRRFYSERIIYLPHSYQPNDNKRPIATTKTTRADVGLPESAFVFCCFNNNYKISPAEFEIWMRLLQKVDGSVLWLLRSNKWAEGNLRKEAAARGIDPSRLVFASRLSHSEHLARHKHADLFIDTFNVNAHTTASDALWSGLPLVTKQGKQFAARVAASLLNAVGLPELIAETDEKYELLVSDLAVHPDKLSKFREKLATNLIKFPLFDTERYTKNFERGLTQVFSLYFNGKEPEDVMVTEDDK